MESWGTAPKIHNKDASETIFRSRFSCRLVSFTYWNIKCFGGFFKTKMFTYVHFSKFVLHKFCTLWWMFAAESTLCLTTWPMVKTSAFTDYRTCPFPVQLARCCLICIFKLGWRVIYMYAIFSVKCHTAMNLSPLNLFFCQPIPVRYRTYMLHNYLRKTHFQPKYIPFKTCRRNNLLHFFPFSSTMFKPLKHKIQQN